MNCSICNSPLIVNNFSNLSWSEGCVKCNLELNYYENEFVFIKYCTNDKTYAWLFEDNSFYIDGKFITRIFPIGDDYAKWFLNILTI